MSTLFHNSERQSKGSAFYDLSGVLQYNFKSAVAIAASTLVDNVVVNSKIEKTIARRVSRKLLATAVEVDFSVKVADAAAATALVASGRLSKADLDVQLMLQVFVHLYIRIYVYVYTFAYIYTFTYLYICVPIDIYFE